MVNYNLLEIVSDISYMAGEQNYFSGDSRSDISEFILWAKIFHEMHEETDWTQIDYIETIQKFSIIMFNSSAV
jgi:hypothetical protein